MHLHLQNINHFIDTLDNKTLHMLESISITKTYKKGEYLLQQDQTCKNSYLISEGMVRKFYLNDGKEITTELYFADDLAVSFYSYCMQKPSREYLQAITELTVSQTDYTAFQKAKKDFPKLIELDLMMNEYCVMWHEDRLFQFHTMDATARYQKILTEHSHIIQNIPLTYIASYLGISLETLSRIRAKI
jgi:CRP-like cAMP-binding protein